MRIKLSGFCGSFVLISVASLMLGACAGNNVSLPSVDEGDQLCSLTTQQQQLLDETNRIRRRGSMCGAVSFPAVADVMWDCRIASAAQEHSADMASIGVLSHTGSNGLELIGRLNAQAYMPSAWSENIAQGHVAVEDVLQGWLASTGHCENLMSAAYEHMGAAVATAADGTRYWTQDFASPL